MRDDVPRSHPDSPEHPDNRRRRVERVNTQGVKRVATSDFDSVSTIDRGDEHHKAYRFREGVEVPDAAWFQLSDGERRDLAYWGRVIPAK